MLSAELSVILFVMESCRRRPPVGPGLYSNNRILLLAWVTLADTCLELEKHLHWLWVLGRNIDFPGLVMAVWLLRYDLTQKVLPYRPSAIKGAQLPPIKGLRELHTDALGQGLCPPKDRGLGILCLLWAAQH